MFPVLPVWVEKLIIQAVKTYLPASVVKQVWQDMLDALAAWAKSLGVPPAIADAVEDLAKGDCIPDLQVLCDIVQNGEKAAIAFLRAQALRTDTKLDDLGVDLLVAAIGVKA